MNRIIKDIISRFILYIIAGFIMLGGLYLTFVLVEKQIIDVKKGEYILMAFFIIICIIIFKIKDFIDSGKTLSFSKYNNTNPEFENIYYNLYQYYNTPTMKKTMKSLPIATGKAREVYMKAQFEERTSFGDSISVEECMIGELENNTALSLSNIFVSTSSGGDIIEIFGGLFATLNFENNVEQKIRITNNSLIKNKNNLIKIYDERFEKYFDVYSVNESETRYILNQYVIEQLVEIREKYNTKYEIVIDKDNIYLRIYTGDIFKVGINSMNKNKLYKDYCAIKMTLEIMNLMKNKIDGKI